jgi:ATP-dependent DNA helicase DinG
VPQDRKRLKDLRNLLSKENDLSFTGKFDEFDGQIDDETISEIQSDSDNCRGKKCDNFGSCYYYAAKRIMERADIVVINHHLLLADVQVAIQKKSEVGLLVHYDKLIIDEAHELESVAAHIFLKKISWKRIMTRFDKIHNDNEKKATHFEKYPVK